MPNRKAEKKIFPKLETPGAAAESNKQKRGGTGGIIPKNVPLDNSQKRVYIGRDAGRPHFKNPNLSSYLKNHQILCY
jgi:hypothetical protein